MTGTFILLLTRYRDIWYACKVIKNPQGDAIEVKQAIQRECEILGRLNH